MNRVRKGLIFVMTLWMLGLSVPAFSDDIEIPFPVKIQPFKEELKLKGLDLYDKEESDGFVINEGTQVTVRLYRRFNDEDLELVKTAAFNNIRKPKNG